MDRISPRQISMKASSHSEEQKNFRDKIEEVHRPEKWCMLLIGNPTTIGDQQENKEMP